MKNNNLLITFPNFSTDKLNENLENWEVISSADLLKKGTWGMVKFIRGKKFNNFVIGKSDLTDQRIKFFLEGFLILARAKNKKIIDNSQRELRIDYFGFIGHLIKFAIEMAFNVVVVIFAYITTLLLSIYVKVPYKTRKVDNKKIAYLRTDYFGEQKTGGSFTHAQGFVKGAMALNWDIFGIAQNKFFEEDIKFYRIPYVAFHNSPEIPEVLYTYKYVWRSLKILKKENPAFLYHRHSFLNISSVYLKRFLKIPLLLEYNGSEPWVREKWGGKLFLKNLAYYFENTVLKNADYIGVVSEVLKEDLIKRGVKAEKIIFNPNGVEIDKFSPEINGSEIRRKYGWDGKIVAGFLGTFGAWHGAEILAAAIKEAVSKNNKLHFLLIGEGNLRPVVDKIIADDGVGAFVTLPGLIGHKEVPQYLAACDILVSPHIPNKDGTKFFGSPTKLFEYMAMGKGIVASDLEQIGKVLENNKTAYLVKPGDIHDLVLGILKIADDVSLREKLGKQAREEAIKNYTWKENAHRIISAYERKIKRA